jgi:hypothetical protein
MEWFLGTTPGVIRNTTFGRRNLSAGPRINSRTRRSHDSGGRGDGGITISRRPNNRPSSEKAPGPSNAIATAVMIIPNATSLASCKPQEGSGNHEKAIPRKHIPTTSPTYGVRNPIPRAAPQIVSVKPANHLSKEGLDVPERYRTPTAVAASPTATRNSSKPMPGLPPGNVEYNLCSADLLARSQKRTYVEIMQIRGSLEPHIAESFRTTFEVLVCTRLSLPTVR